MPLLLLFFSVALLYSAVGFGGGSSYTALLALAGESPLTIRWTALLCNLFVVSIGLWRHWRGGALSFSLVTPFLLFSVPVVMWTTRWQLEERSFFLLLGGALSLAGSLLLFPISKHATLEKQKIQSAATATLSQAKRWTYTALLGTGLGALAGLTGIGGGIYLSPLLLLLKFENPKRIAALASAFIFVNSLAALLTLGFTTSLTTLGRNPFPLLGAVGIGGLIGSRLLHGTLPEASIRRLTGILVLFVGMRVLFLHF